jgi:hypothetical protein
MRQLNNGDVVVAGSRYATIWLEPNGDTSALAYGSLVKINANGNILWAKKYTSPLPDTLIYRLYDMRSTADGGFVFVGEATDNIYAPQTNPIQRAWIVKVDSNGCMGNNDPQCWKVGVNESGESTKEISVYPNPAHDKVYTKTTLASDGSITIYDISGKQLLYQTLTPKGTTITDISGFAPGIYIYRIATKNQPLIQGKLVKE